MEQTTIAILVVIIIVIAFAGFYWWRHRSDAMSGSAPSPYAGYDILEQYPGQGEYVSRDPLDWARNHSAHGADRVEPRSIEEYTRDSAGIRAHANEHIDEHFLYDTPRGRRIDQYVSKPAMDRAARDMYSDAAGHVFDHTKTAYPGDDYNMHSVQADDNYEEHLVESTLEPSIVTNHAIFVKKSKPFSQVSMAIDDLDEAVAMSSRQGWGINTFRKDTPAQGPNTREITEADPYLYAEHATPLIIGS